MTANKHGVEPEVCEVIAEWESLRCGNAFVLDLGMDIFYFQKRDAKVREKVAGNQVHTVYGIQLH